MTMDLMEEQKLKLIEMIHAKPYVVPEAVTALVLIEILERLNAFKPKAIE